MKFVLVNHDTPFCAATCNRCAQSIRSGYVRQVRTQQRYCGYDCYRRSEFDALVMQWPMSTRLAAGNVEAAACNIIEMLAVLSAVSCWSCTMQIWTFARHLTGAYLDGRNLITLEGGDA